MPKTGRNGHEETSLLNSRVNRGLGLRNGAGYRNAGHAGNARMERKSGISERCEIATLVGDPTKAGSVVVQRIKFPPNFQMPPHTHPFSEVVTIISGTVGSSHGEKFAKNGDLLKPGSLWVYPAKHPHYAWTGTDGGVLQVQYIGPGGIDYINPEDDPRKKGH